MGVILQHIRQANTGRKILRDWKVNGCIPVPIEQAQSRANICLKCPLNESDDNWTWDRSAADRAKAFYIAHSLNLRRMLNIRLEGDEKLNTCAACGCVLKLKVHSPLTHIIRHTPSQEYSRYPDFCWVKTENNNHKSTT